MALLAVLVVLLTWAVVPAAKTSRAPSANNVAVCDVWHTFDNLGGKSGQTVGLIRRLATEAKNASPHLRDLAYAAAADFAALRHTKPRIHEVEIAPGVFTSSEDETPIARAAFKVAAAMRRVGRECMSLGLGG